MAPFILFFGNFNASDINCPQVSDKKKWKNLTCRKQSALRESGRESGFEEKKEDIKDK